MTRKSLFLLNLSFNCNTLDNQGWRPYLTFDFVVVSHQFNPTPYFIEHKDRKEIQGKVWELHKSGWGYTKIHQYLTKNGYEIGKSRTTVDSMIKKIKKRDEFFSQPILDGIGNFRIKMLEIK